ncbi:hypothetical protein V6N13_015136 [Hibiscus sabdariffa]
MLICLLASFCLLTLVLFAGSTMPTGIALISFLLFYFLKFMYWFILMALNRLVGRCLYLTLLLTSKSYYLALFNAVLSDSFGYSFAMNNSYFEPVMAWHSG